MAEYLLSISLPRELEGQLITRTGNKTSSQGFAGITHTLVNSDSRAHTFLAPSRAALPGYYGICHRKDHPQRKSPDSLDTCVRLDDGQGCAGTGA